MAKKKEKGESVAELRAEMSKLRKTQAVTDSWKRYVFELEAENEKLRNLVEALANFISDLPSRRPHDDNDSYNREDEWD